jgi:4-amino-4-deoxychorismate lyase
VNFIKKTAKEFDLNITAIKSDVFKFLEKHKGSYDIIFADPPYGIEQKEFEKLKASAKTEEIIIVKNNHITDTSFSNLIFLKDKSWFTPQSYLLNGVMRQHLLQNKKIKECEITLQNLKEFSHFSIINAMNTMEDAFVYPIDVIINLPNNNSYLDL